MSKDKKMPKLGERYYLHYCGKNYPYKVSKINDKVYLIHESRTPLGVPLTSIPIEEFKDYDKEYGFTKIRGVR